MGKAAEMPAPEFADWSEREEIEEAGRRCVELQESVAAMTEELKAWRTFIREAQLDEGEARVEGSNWRSFMSFPNPSKKLNPKKLVEKGVSLEVIEQCYDYTEKAPYNTIKAIAQEK